MSQHDLQPMTEDVTSVVQPLQVALVGHRAEQVVGRRKGETGGPRKLLGLRTPIELGHHLEQPQGALHGLDQRRSSCLFGHPPGPSVTCLSVGRAGEVVYANDSPPSEPTYTFVRGGRRKTPPVTASL